MSDKYPFLYNPVIEAGFTKFRDNNASIFFNIFESSRLVSEQANPIKTPWSESLVRNFHYTYFNTVVRKVSSFLEQCSFELGRSMNFYYPYRNSRKVLPLYFTDMESFLFYYCFADRKSSIAFAGRSFREYIPRYLPKK
jgi:hypothetical protein